MRLYHFNRYFNKDIISSDILTVSMTDLELLKLFLKKKHVNPYKVYVIYNYEIGYEEIILYHLKYTKYKFHDLDVRLSILIEWNSVVKLFNKGKFHAVLENINNLDINDSIIDIKNIKIVLSKFINNIKIPFLEKGLFLNKHYDKKVIGTSNNCLSEFFSLPSKLSIINFNDTKWTKLEQYKNNLILIIPNNLRNTNLIQERSFFMSIYFYKIALYHQLVGNYTMSLNLLHRTLDMYLHYLCQKNSVNNCGRYLHNKYTSLQNTNGFNAYYEQIKIKLNNTRNKLYLTHGLYSIQKNELSQMLIDIKKFTIDTDGYSWNNKLKELELPFKLKPLDLFLYEPSFQTYYNEINLGN